VPASVCVRAERRDYEHALIYKTAILSGLRLNELLRLSGIGLSDFPELTPR